MHRSRIRYLSKKNSRILTNFPKLKKFVKIRKKFVKCPSGCGLPTTTEEFDAFHSFVFRVRGTKYKTNLQRRFALYSDLLYE